MTTKKGISKEKKELTVDEKYQKLEHHEHILKLPDTYIGSVLPEQVDMWVYDDSAKKMIKKNITHVPGLLRVYDEILVNARDRTVVDQTCDTIKINIDKDKGEISIWNNGMGIEVELHKKEQLYVPTLIFGTLLTSSNYNQTGKIVGGKNGYGAKLANIFSTKFEIETVDTKNKKKFYQCFSNNMFDKKDPIITPIKRKDTPYTKVTFIPDFKRFGINELSDDFVALFKKRAYDIAACTNDVVKVYLNNELIKVATFEDYIKLFYDDPNKIPVYAEVNERWKIGVVYTPDAGFSHMSFVNGIWTYSPQGGTHVNHVVDQIMKGLMDYIITKHKGINVKTSYLKEGLALFVDSVIEDPAFSTQSKECLTNKISDFKIRCDITNDFINQVAKTGIIDDAIQMAQLKDLQELKKSDGKKTVKSLGLTKLEPAKWAGTKKSQYCTLIITEGDSAKAFAVWGLEVIGREKFGVFPIRGKMLNVRDASPQQLAKNEEIKNIKKIMGLKQGIVYDDVSKLNYGKILVLADQDDDGHHIKGLVVNFIHYFWPALLKNNEGFIQALSTPIIKAYKNTDTKRKNPVIFYSINEYKEWEKQQGSKTKLWDVQYYKGLGTSEPKEAKLAFNDFDKKVLSFVWETDQENKLNQQTQHISETDNDDDSNNGKSETDKEDLDVKIDYEDVTSKSYIAIDKAFSKQKADLRKEWLKKYDPSLLPEIIDQKLPYSEFIDKQLIHFSNYDNIRSLPSLCDGLKPSLRKILYVTMLKKIDSPARRMKVGNLASLVSNKTCYLHGEKSLCEAIVGMAQRFVGSNNITLLYPKGNFGYRNCGGDNHASERYTFTYIDELTRLIFRKEDDNVCDKEFEEGQEIEPKYFAPIIPMILVNGSKGIGTGYSTTIPSYNPTDIVNNIFNLLEDKPPVPMIPWYRGFIGEINHLVGNEFKFKVHGCYEAINDHQIKITELPIGVWTDSYKEFLETLVANQKMPKKTQFLESYDSNSGNNNVDISLLFSGLNLQRLLKSDDVEKKLKLVGSISTSNMYMYNEKKVLVKYDNAEDILTAYYKFRLDMYEKRKEYTIKILENELNILYYKRLFLQKYIAKVIILENKKKSDVIKKLIELKFPKLSHDINAIDSNDDDNDEAKPVEQNDDDDNGKKKSFRTYKYITDTQLFSITKEKLDELNDAYEKGFGELENYKKTSIKDIWKKELNEFLDAYNKWLIKVKNDDEDDEDSKKKPRKRIVTKPTKKIIKTNKKVIKI